MITRTHLAKIRWQCRRGMLELDELLQTFFDQQYLQLTSHEQKAFERLLTYTDPELFAWLLNQQQVNDAELYQIVKKIRASRH